MARMGAGRHHLEVVGVHVERVVVVPHGRHVDVGHATRAYERRVKILYAET